MKTEEEAYWQLRDYGYSHEDAKRISKALYEWANQPEELSIPDAEKGKKE